MLTLSRHAQGRNHTTVEVSLTDHVLRDAHAGLAKVLHHLLDYSEGQGNEVYLKSVDHWPQLHNRPFGEVAFSTCAWNKRRRHHRHPASESAAVVVSERN
jgi:hypothetical protein